MRDYSPVSVADDIVAGVVARHPHVEVDAWTSGADGSRCVNFVPRNDAGASVTVTVDILGSVVVECGACVLRDVDYVSVGTVIENTVKLVLAFADHGYVKVRTVWALGSLSPSLVGPASGFFGLDDYIDRPLSEVVDVLDPWSPGPSA